MKYDYLIKVKTVGDSNVGKSSIVVRFVDDTFSGQMAPTIGVEYKSKIFEVYGKRVKATIWDTAGAERYRTITSNYYRGSHGIIFVYDVTCRASFENIEKYWLKEVKEYFPNPSEIVMMLVGNKIDNQVGRVVSEEEGEDLARVHGMMFIETSAKEKIGVNEAFEEVVNKVIESPMLEQITLKSSMPKAAGNRGLNVTNQTGEPQNDNQGSYTSYSCCT